MTPFDTVFDDYANFSNPEHTPELPIKSAPNLGEKMIGHGAFTTTIDIGEGKVAKLSRMLGQKDGPFRVDANDGAYLVSKTEDEEQDKKEVIQSMLDLAKEKEETYKMLGEYIGEYLPDIYFYAIVESPRKEIERYKGSNRPSGPDLSNIPTSEVSLMEVWEQIDARGSLSNMQYEQLTELQGMENFKTQLADLSSKAYSLLLKEGIMLDICDWVGVRGTTPNKSGAPVKKLEDLLTERDKATLFVPRNIAWSNEQIKYFDTYPVFDVYDLIDHTTLVKLCDLAELEDWPRIQEMCTNGGDKKAQLEQVARYLFLLQQMGTNLRQ